MNRFELKPNIVTLLFGGTIVSLIVAAVLLFNNYNTNNTKLEEYITKSYNLHLAQSSVLSDQIDIMHEKNNYAELGNLLTSHSKIINSDVEALNSQNTFLENNSLKSKYVKFLTRFSDFLNKQVYIVQNSSSIVSADYADLNKLSENARSESIQAVKGIEFLSRNIDERYWDNSDALSQVVGVDSVEPVAIPQETDYEIYSNEIESKITKVNDVVGKYMNAWIDADIPTIKAYSTFDFIEKLNPDVSVKQIQGYTKPISYNIGEIKESNGDYYAVVRSINYYVYSITPEPLPSRVELSPTIVENEDGSIEFKIAEEEISIPQVLGEESIVGPEYTSVVEYKVIFKESANAWFIDGQRAIP